MAGGITIRHLALLQNSRNPEIQRVGQSLNDIANLVQSIATQAGLQGSSQALIPSTPQQINVVASNGIADVQIIDNSIVFKAITYYVEYSTSPGFTAATTHVYALGSARNARIPIFLGATPVYFRAYSQYPGSAASAPVYFGTAGNPTGVNTGGTGPTLQAGQSSGTGNPTVDSGVGSGPSLKREPLSLAV